MMSSYSEIFDQSIVLENQLKSNNDYILALNKNMETLISGYQLILNVVQNHENMLNNVMTKQKDCNSLDMDNSRTEICGTQNCETKICGNNMNVGANETVYDMMAISNVELEDPFEDKLDLKLLQTSKPGDSSVIPTETVFDVISIKAIDDVNDVPQPDSSNADNDDISSIASDISDLINPEFIKVNMQSTTLHKDASSDNEVVDGETCDVESETDCSSSSGCKSDYEGFHHYPYELHHKSVFSLFKVNELAKSTDFTNHFDNRSVAFYGEYPYSYSNITHEPQPFTNNKYLAKLLSYVEIVYPCAKFNSAMVHSYCSGDDHIPMHSDSEGDIVDGSSIITISLGDTRDMKFKEKDSSFTSSVSLQNGDSLIMTKSSQKYFAHGIPPQESKSLRMSITLRLLNPPKVNRFQEPKETITSFSSEPVSECVSPPGPKPQNTSSQNVYNSMGQENPNSRKFNAHKLKSYDESTRPVRTIYISSSMFRFLDPYRMSSSQQKAQVFFYPGATAGQMIKRLFQDPDFRALDRKSVNQIFILSGTNNVDAVFSRSQTISEVTSCLSELLGKVWTYFDHPKINVINILPRDHEEKNRIVLQLNQLLYKECQAHGLTFLNTELGPEPIFSHSNGFRNNNLFSNGVDNVHLNQSGYFKLARYLKYLAHHK